jgi:hypothetical protein
LSKIFLGQIFARFLCAVFDKKSSKIKVFLGNGACCKKWGLEIKFLL